MVVQYSGTRTSVDKWNRETTIGNHDLQLVLSRYLTNWLFHYSLLPYCRYVVERFGKLSAIEDSGWFLGIPFVDKIAYIIDIRERAMDIPPQSAITRDNVSVEVSGNLFVLFNDAEKAAYGAFNPLYSVMQVRIITGQNDCCLGQGFKIRLKTNLCNVLKLEQ